MNYLSDPANPQNLLSPLNPTGPNYVLGDDQKRAPEIKEIKKIEEHVCNEYCPLLNAIPLGIVLFFFVIVQVKKWLEKD